MFDLTREYDMNMTQVFVDQSWALVGLGYKHVDPKAS